jgi:hypothetical protein
LGFVRLINPAIKNAEPITINGRNFVFNDLPSMAIDFFNNEIITLLLYK